MDNPFAEKKEDPLKEKLIEHLHIKECKLEDGSIVENLDGICQMLIGRSLDGDLTSVQMIRDLIKK